MIYQFLYANLFPKVYARNTQFGIQNKAIFEYTYREWYTEKTNKQNSSISGSSSNGNVASKDQADGNFTSSEAPPALGKKPETYEEREMVNEFEQQPEEIKFVSLVQKKTKRPKAVSIEAQMGARIATRRRKTKQKKAMLETKLVENTSEMNKLKNFAKK